MAERNAWAKTADTPTAEDAEVIEAERVLTMADIAKLPTLADQLDALNGSPVPTMGVDELRLWQDCAAWFAGACGTNGAPLPPDVLRSVLGCAFQVVSFNVALDQAGEPSAVPMPTEH